MHPELEPLIQAVLEDGVITDKEREVLHRKATALGVDVDEVDIIIDARLHKHTKEAAGAKPQTKKCPSCAEPISGLNKVCSACGFIFEGSTGGSGHDGPGLHQTIEELEDLIVKIKAFPVPGLWYVYEQMQAKANRGNPMAKLMGQSDVINQTLAEDTSNLDALIARADGLKRRVRTYFGEDKKIRVLLEEMTEEVAKKTGAVEKAKKTSKTFVVVFMVGLVAFAVLMLAYGPSISNHIRSAIPTPAEESSEGYELEFEEGLEELFE